LEPMTSSEVRTGHVSAAQTSFSDAYGSCVRVGEGLPLKLRREMHALRHPLMLYLRDPLGP
jgi:hypothetical protein